MRTFHKPKQNHSQQSCSLSLRFLNGFHMSSSRHGHGPRGSKHPKTPGSSREETGTEQGVAPPIPAPGFSHPILLQGLDHPLGTRGAAGCARGLGGFPKGNEFWGQPYLPRRLRVTESSEDRRPVGFKSAGTTSQRSCSKAGREGKELRGMGTWLWAKSHSKDTFLGFFFSPLQPQNWEISKSRRCLRIFIMYTGLALKVPWIKSWCTMSFQNLQLTLV